LMEDPTINKSGVSEQNKTRNVRTSTRWCMRVDRNEIGGL
jgi:hypothetical protein